LEFKSLAPAIPSQVPGGEVDISSVQSADNRSPRIEEPLMILLCRGLFASPLVIALAVSAWAQGAPSGRSAPHHIIATPPTLTGKERLGRKWTDEQRVDNCNVPIDKRGSKPRPATCASPADQVH
jgi:hypothetical protein